MPRPKSRRENNRPQSNRRDREVFDRAPADPRDFRGRNDPSGYDYRVIFITSLIWFLFDN
jgi:hypothetical protein